MMIPVLFLCLSMNMSQPTFDRFHDSTVPDETELATILNEVNDLGEVKCEQPKDWLATGRFEGANQFQSPLMVLNGLRQFILSNNITRS